MTDVTLSDIEIDAHMARCRHPAIAMLHTASPDLPGTPGCWFGGQPTLPPNIQWPVYRFPETEIEIPLHFLVQINLDYVPRVLGLPPLPATGTLFVFYEQRIASYVPIANPEFEPPLLNGEGIRVIYVDHDVSQYAQRQPPPMPDFADLSYEYEAVADDFPRSEYEKWNFNFVVVDTYPSPGAVNPQKGCDLPSECLGRVVKQRQQTFRDLQDLRFSGSGVEEDKYPNLEINTVFGAWRGLTLPTAEKMAKFTHHSVGAVSSDHIVLFRFDDSIIGKGSLNAFGEAVWIRKQDLIMEVFDNVFVWEVN